MLGVLLVVVIWLLSRGRSKLGVIVALGGLLHPGSWINSRRRGVLAHWLVSSSWVPTAEEEEDGKANQGKSTHTTNNSSNDSTSVTLGATIVFATIVVVAAASVIAAVIAATSARC